MYNVWFITINIAKNKKSMKTTMKKMNRVEEQLKANGFFWLERLVIILTVLFPTQLLDLISIPMLISTTCYELYFFFSFPDLIFVGPSGIGGFWLFLLDRLTFYLAFEYYTLLAGGFELTFLWYLTALISFVIHSVYIVEYLLRSGRAVPIPPLIPQNDKSSGGVCCKHVEEMKALLEYGRKMMTCTENMISSDAVFRRKEREELNKYEKKMMNKLVDFICPRIETLKEIMIHNDKEIWQVLQQVKKDVKHSIMDFNKDVKSMADQVHEIYLDMQETVKEVNAIETNVKDQSKTQVIKGENVEGFSELKEQVRRMAIEGEIAAEELERETLKLVRAEMHQWEEDNADYIASLPLLYLSSVQ